MNPNCWLVERRLSVVVARGESPDPTLVRHLNVCPRCRAFHADLTALTSDLGALASPHGAPGLEARVLARLTGAPTRRGSRAPAVAAFALAAIVPLALWGLRPPRPTTAPVQKLVLAPTPPPAPTAPRITTPKAPTPHVAPRRRWRAYPPVTLVHRAPATPPRDDLAYVNGDSFEAYARRTGALLRRDPDPLLKALPSDRAGDDFVAVPLPQLAGVGDAGNAAALARYEQERQVVDTRLQRAVTLGVKRISLAELCEKLSRETDITFTASRAVADEKLTLFCKDRPVRDLLRQLNQLMGFVWERSGAEDAWTYKLTEPLKVRLLEEELRNRDRNEALLALDRDMDGYKDLLGLSPDDARALAEGAGSERDRQRLKKLGGMGWGPAQLYQGLGSEERDALLAGQNLRFGGEGSAHAIPENLRRSILDSLRGHAFIDEGGKGMHIYGDRDSESARAQKGTAPGALPGVEPTAALRLQRNELGDFSLYGNTGFTGKGMGGSSAVELAKGVSPSAASPNNADANAAHRNEPAYRRKIDLGEQDKLEGAPRKGKRTTADLLEAFHKATGRDVIGDYYTRLYEPGSLWPTGAVATFDALNRACDATRLRWRDTDRWLTFRSTDFFNMRLKEVPNRLLDHWTARRRLVGYLDADQLREIARLTDFQLDASGMAEGARSLWGLEEWDEVRAENLRPIWRFLDGLPGSQRAAMLGAGGLRYGALGLDAQQKFVGLVYYPGEPVRQSLEEGSADPGLVQRLAGASVEFTNDPKRMPAGAGITDSQKRAWYLISRCPVGANQIRLRVLGRSGTSSTQLPE